MSHANHHDDEMTLNYLDRISEDVPHTLTRACHLLYHLVSRFSKPEVVEVACCYGKATLYLAAAAKHKGGFVNCVDIAEYMWKGKSAVDLLRQASLLGVCRITFGRDARWYLLDLFQHRMGQWIDLAYLDLTHTVEVDSFVALALWTHIRPSGIMVFDDLDWVPAVHGVANKDLSDPNVSNVQVIYDYISSMPDVDERMEWGKKEVNWRWGIIRKKCVHETDAPPIEQLIRGFVL